MYDLPDTDSIAAVLTQPIDPTLYLLLADRLSDIRRCGLEAYTHVLVIEAGDVERAIVNAIGFSPLRSRIDGIPNQPDWDWIERHDGWWELLYTVSNDGFAFIILVEDNPRSALAMLCREYA